MANTSLRLKCKGSTRDLVLYLYQRDPEQREKEVAICGLLWDEVPVPDIIVHGDCAVVLHEPYALMAWVDFAGRPDAGEDLLDHARTMIDRVLDWAVPQPKTGCPGRHPVIVVVSAGRSENAVGARVLVT